MKTRDFAFWMVAKLDGKEQSGLPPEEVLQIQRVLANVLVSAARAGGSPESTLPDPEKVGNGATFEEVAMQILIGAPHTQED